MEKEAEKSTNGVDEVDKWAAERMDRYESDCLYRQRIIRRPKQVDYLDDTPINMGMVFIAWLVATRFAVA